MGKAELNIEVDRLLLEQARSAGVDVSAVAEQALKAALGSKAAEARARRWTEENRQAIAEHQKRLDAHGAFSDDLRTW